ncbi:MAG TPA: hypothetical protein VGO62_16610, partial [Myxococcota bacterium]
ESEADVVALLAFALGLPADALPPTCAQAVARAGPALAARGASVVVLDGIHDIRAAATPLARALAEHTRVIATARVPLAVMGERVIDVGPLALPAANASRSEMLASPAVQLLVHAIEAETGAAHSEDPAALAEVARGSGGMPAALLLAARWLVERRGRSLGDELSRRTGETPLAALFAGGMQDLDDEERSAVARLAPHRGPLVRALVDALVPERDPDELVQALRRKSVVVGDALVPAARDRALDELAAKGELVEVRVRHAEALAVLLRAAVERCDDATFGPDAQKTLVDMRGAAEDAVAALLARGERDVADADAGRVAVDTAVLVLALALDAAGPPRAAPQAHLRLLDEALARAGTQVDQDLRARALEARGDQHKLAGRLHEARRDYLLALDLVDGDDAAASLLLRNIADLDLDAFELVSAEARARAAIAAARRANNMRLLARATWTLGRLALRRGHVAEAEILLERAAGGFHSAGDTRFSARATFELGRCAEARGDLRAARDLLTRALLLHDELGDVVFAERARLHLGAVAAWLGDDDEARARFTAARDSARDRGDHRAAASAQGHLDDLAGATRPTEPGRRPASLSST